MNIKPRIKLYITTQEKIMNSRKLSLALATVATILSGNILPSHAAPSPSKGFVCPTGFTGEVIDGAFRCKRVTRVLIENICTNPQFPKLNLRAKDPSNIINPGDFNKNGRDLCSRANASIPATGPLTGLNPGRDFVPSVPDPAARRRADERLEQGFVRGQVQLPSLAQKRQPEILPRIAASEREAVFVSEQILIDDAGDIDDHTRVTFNLFTFGIKKQ
jgi:hypothetical protein